MSERGELNDCQLVNWLLISRSFPDYKSWIYGLNKLRTIRFVDILLISAIVCGYVCRSGLRIVERKLIGAYFPCSFTFLYNFWFCSRAQHITQTCRYLDGSIGGRWLLVPLFLYIFLCFSLSSRKFFLCFLKSIYCIFRNASTSELYNKIQQNSYPLPTKNSGKFFVSF